MPPRSVGPNRFVRFLSARLAGIDVGLARQIAAAVFIADVGAHALEGFGGDVGGVCAHVRNVAGLVESLRQGHGPAHAEAESRRRRLLQSGGDERRVGPRGGLAIFAAAHGKDALAQPVDRVVGRRAVAGLEVRALFFLHLESNRGAGWLAGARQVCERFPILNRLEGADLAFAIHDQPGSDGLHATSGEAARQFRPQQRRQLETHHRDRGSGAPAGR